MSDRLSHEELRVAFNARVLPDYLEPQRDGARDSIFGPPRFVSVGGQPGSGKGGVLQQTQASMPGSVVVNGDDLRQFHPAYGRLMREDPLRMPEVTGPASGPWVGMSNEYLRGQGVSAIVETTLRDATMLRQEFGAFKAAGYETELRVVAVPLEVSRLGTVSRYVEQVQDFGAGRWTPGAAHDEAAANVRETVRELVSSGAVDRVVVVNRDGHVFHDAVVSSGGVARGEAAALAVDHARDVQNLSPAQAQSWVEVATHAVAERERLGQHDPDLVRVSKQVVTKDAALVVPQAYPGDTRAQREALGRLERAGKLSLSDRISGRADVLKAAKLSDAQPSLNVAERLRWKGR